MRLPLPLRALSIFLFYLSRSVQAADQTPLDGSPRRGYNKGDLLPVTCLNRTIDTGEHITDSHGNLQYIPFPTCNETALPLAFPYGTPLTQICTIDELPDELYHLFEFFVHSDVPLTCRVPTYPLDSLPSASQPATDMSLTPDQLWTPFTIAVQGTLQISHLHLHTNINVLFHTSDDLTQVSSKSAPPSTSHLIASSAYSVPNTNASSPKEGTKIMRYEPLVLTFNVGWIDGDVLPGMVGRPMLGIKDHSVGLSLLSFFALAASAGLGAMGMLVYERKKSGRSLGKYANGLLGGNVGWGLPNGGGMNGGFGNGSAAAGGAGLPGGMNGAPNGQAVRSTGYGGYGGYGVGKRD